MTTVADLRLFAGDGAKFFSPITYYRWDVEEQFEVELTEQQWDDLVEKLESTYLELPNRLYADVIEEFLGEMKPKKLGEWVSVDLWEAEYHPYQNWLVENPSWANDGEQGCLFETYGVEWEFIRRQDEHHVWSYVQEDDGGLVLLAGIVNHLNPIGFLVTAKPWKSVHEYVVVC